MNIDKEPTSGFNYIFYLLADKENKMDKCNECKYQYTSMKNCLGCVVNPAFTNNFKPKPNLLQNIFKGAPVMVRDGCNNWVLRSFYSVVLSRFYTKECNDSRDIGWEELRIPTIEESPRNTWIAHSGEDKCPEGLEKLIILIWCKDRDYPSTPIIGIDVLDWSKVARLMIIDKGAFK